jgi:hypothetical protein
VVDRANAMLASAVRLREAVAEQGGTLRDPANRRLSGPQLLERVTPALEAVAGELDRFERALAATGRLWTGASCKPLESGWAGQVCMVAKTITLDR